MTRFDYIVYILLGTLAGLVMGWIGLGFIGPENFPYAALGLVSSGIIMLLWDGRMREWMVWLIVAFANCGMATTPMMMFLSILVSNFYLVLRAQNLRAT